MGKNRNAYNLLQTNSITQRTERITMNWTTIAKIIDGVWWLDPPIEEKELLFRLNRKWLKLVSKELAKYFSHVEAEARDKGYEEGARMQALLDAKAIKEARKEERKRIIN
jgi:hypothetical protein